MSRQRFIHPEIFESQDFLMLSHGARLLFIGMFTLADDHGRGRGNPLHLAGSVFPGESVPISDWITEVSARNLAQFYESGGSVYYLLPSWQKWQKPKYVAASKVPEPGPNLGQFRPELSRNPDTGSNGDGEGREGKETYSARPRARSVVSSEGFEEFWTCYPRKIAKAAALKAWNKLKPSPELRTTIHTALAAQRESDQWLKDNGVYAPYPSTWLNGHRWEDELNGEPLGTPDF